MDDGCTWSFFQAHRHRKFLLVVIDDFIKWIETEPLAKITEARVKYFIQKSIICHFDLSRILIIDNRHQFISFKFVEFYRDLGIFHYFTSVGHPQDNREGRSKLLTELFYRN